jgi:hypothetical protein
MLPIDLRSCSDIPNSSPFAHVSEIFHPSKNNHQLANRFKKILEYAGHNDEFIYGVRHAMLRCMSDQGSDDDQAVEQRFDALLLKLLKTPPQSRAELTEAVRRAKGKPTRTRAKRASAGKRRGAASQS